MGRQRLGQHAPQQQRQQKAKPCQKVERAAPAAMRLQPSAEHWRQRRSQAEHHHHHRHHALRLRALEAVLHHGTHDHHARARAHTLHEAHQDQHLDVGHKRCGQRRQPIADGRRHQHAATPEGVAERAIEQHGAGHGQHVRAQRLLHGSRAHIELFGDGVERGQIGVDTQRTNHGAQGEQKREQGKSRHVSGKRCAAGAARTQLGAQKSKRPMLPCASTRSCDASRRAFRCGGHCGMPMVGIDSGLRAHRFLADLAGVGCYNRWSWRHETANG
ncbi:hypothetical protein SDC9_105003 [bioreactor metagenome]|uniref:Uncharacterized protein n=1 Tax=bioreactor metagenome TaxID=1076179 RepID=A0A645B918_9ZZZZ